MTLVLRVSVADDDWPRSNGQAPAGRLRVPPQRHRHPTQFVRGLVVLVPIGKIERPSGKDLASNGIDVALDTPTSLRKVLHCYRVQAQVWTVDGVPAACAALALTELASGRAERPTEGFFRTPAAAGPASLARPRGEHLLLLRLLARGLQQLVQMRRPLVSARLAPGARAPAAGARRRRPATRLAVGWPA
jgi:hypothetical protein